MADDELVIDIAEMIQRAEDHGLSRALCSIYKVPRSLREKNACIYTPTTISIGPFHYGNWRLKGMERHKVIMLKKFTQRAKNLSLKNLISFIRDSEKEVRASYSEDTTKLSGNKFQKLMLLDAAFIIELFLSILNPNPIDDKEMDAILPLLQPKLLSDISKDLLLLENQLPFRFLEALYAHALPFCHPPFIELSYMFFESLNFQHLKPDLDVRLNHFTDLLRLFHLPTRRPRRVSLFQGSDEDILLYSAEQLAEVDLRFRASKGERRCPLELNFSGNILEVPRILVDNNFVIFFHNMIALEQCHYPDEHYLCDYALLLDCLINSQEDVNVLISKGIIQNSLGDPYDVVKIFDGLSTDLTLLSIDPRYSDICRELNSIGTNPWRQMKRALKRQLLVSIVGFVLNMLTLIQTIFSILQVVLR